VRPAPILLLLASACGRAADYTAVGDLIAVDPPGSQVTIRHEAIPGLMGGMTMRFPVSAPGVLAQAVPGTRVHFNGHAWADLWPQDPWTRGSYAAFGVGQYTRYWAGTARPEGDVHFAGEATSTHSQGFLFCQVKSFCDNCRMDTLGDEPISLLQQLPNQQHDRRRPISDLIILCHSCPSDHGRCRILNLHF